MSESLLYIKKRLLGNLLSLNCVDVWNRVRILSYEASFNPTAIRAMMTAVARKMSWA